MSLFGGPSTAAPGAFGSGTPLKRSQTLPLASDPAPQRPQLTLSGLAPASVSPNNHAAGEDGAKEVTRAQGVDRREGSRKKRRYDRGRGRTAKGGRAICGATFGEETGHRHSGAEPLSKGKILTKG